MGPFDLYQDILGGPFVGESPVLVFLGFSSWADQIPPKYSSVSFSQNSDYRILGAECVGVIGELESSHFSVCTVIRSTSVLYSWAG